MAFFLDLDGTLAEIEQNPAAVRVTERMREVLRHLVETTEGAVAVVSGRSIAEADRLLRPLRLPTAGLHGAERRDPSGHGSRRGVDDAALDAMRCRLAALVEAHPGLLLEAKPTGLALHYRAVPALKPLVRQRVAEILAPYSDAFALQPGKMVLEVKPQGVDKGRAIAAFLAEAPFAGRRPVFAGDDTTDEAGFALVNAEDGLSIKIGEGESQARHRLPSVGALAQWLSELEVGTA